jgi:tRNA (guanine-N(7)-)-methyltransferase subunit TRM82
MYSGIYSLFLFPHELTLYVPSYTFDFTPPTTKPIPDEFSSHENPSDGKLILGHASPLTAFSLSQDEKYIITADRDEHIRVSWYPQGYNIEMYCLGHCKLRLFQLKF